MTVRELALAGLRHRQLTMTVRELALAGLRHRHPYDTPEQHRRRLADLLLGPELAARIYGLPVEGG